MYDYRVRSFPVKLMLDFSSRKTKGQAFLFYLVFGVGSVIAVMVLGAVLGLSIEAVDGLLAFVALVLPSVLTFLVVKGRSFPSKYFALILLSLVLSRVGGPGGLLVAMIVPAGLTSRKSEATAG